MVNYNRTAGWQFHFTLECGFDLTFDLETAEQRHRIFVQLDLTLISRHHLLDKIHGFDMNFRVVDQNFTHILTQVVTHRTNDNVAFLIHQERSWTLIGCTFNGIPQLDQVVQIPLKFFSATAHTGSTNDDAHIRWHGQLIHRIAQLSTVITLDTTGDAASTGIIRHQHQVAPRQADECGQGCTLVTALFFINLNDNFGAFLYHIFDIDAATDFGRFLEEILFGDLFQRQKAMTFCAKIDKRRFQAWFNTSDTATIDVGFFLFTGAGFNIQIVQSLAVYQGYTQLFRLSCVD